MLEWLDSSSTVKTVRRRERKLFHMGFKGKV